MGLKTTDVTFFLFISPHATIYDLHNENRNWHNRAIYSSIMRHTDVSLMTHKNDLMIVISVLQTVINAP